jgi:YcaO-like protein with predicted kinase domain
VLHGLHELVERASLSVVRASPPSRRVYVDPASCRDPAVTQIHDALRAAGCMVVARDVTGPTGIPCYVATIWSPDMPMRCRGSGCHVDPAIALGRAMAEAMLTRLAAISGARDDIDGSAYRQMRRPDEPAGLVSVPGEIGWADDGDLRSVIRHCALRVAAVTGAEPFVIRLSHDDIGIPAVKVLAPGLQICRGPVAAPGGREQPGPVS